jgi:hypothetical protein
MFDSVMESNLKDISYNIKFNNWDWLHLNSGIERSGKSGFSLAQAMFLSKTCGLNFPWNEDLPNVFFFEKNLASKMLNIANKSIVIIDEGGEALMSRKAMEREVIKVVQTLMIYGSKNVFLIINIPDWRWVDKYVRQSRVRSLCEINTIPRFIRSKEVEDEVRVVRERGFYSFFSRRKVLKASEHEPATLGKPNFYGRFASFKESYPNEWEWYSEKKTEFLKEKAETQFKKVVPTLKKSFDENPLIRQMDARLKAIAREGAKQTAEKAARKAMEGAENAVENED